MNKSYVILQMYDALNSGRKLRINECCGEYDISVSTFRRYMALLRSYYGEFLGEEIIYSPENAEYSLEK